MFSDAGFESGVVRKVSEGSPHILDLIKSGVIRMVISTLTTGKRRKRTASRFAVPPSNMRFPA